MTEEPLASSRKLFDGVESIAFYVSIGFHWRFFSPKKVINCFHNWDIEWLIFGILSRGHRRGCENYILRVHMNTSTANFFLKKKTIVFDHSRTLSVFFDPMLKHFRRSCEYYLLRVHRIILMKNFSLKKLQFFNLFETLRKNFSAFCQKFFGRFVKNAFYISIVTFRWKLFFLWINSSFSNTFRHWPKNLWPLLENFSTGLSR